MYLKFRSPDLVDLFVVERLAGLFVGTFAQYP